MTNREWLNSLSDDNLSKVLCADFIGHICNHNQPCGYNGYHICVLKWLKEEYGE